MYMHSHDDKYPARPGFVPGTSRLQAPVNTNEPLGQAILSQIRFVKNTQNMTNTEVVLVSLLSMRVNIMMW